MKLLTTKILQALFEAKISNINESYATVKDRFIRDGANKAEIKSLLDLHKKLKDMKRLKAEEINIDVLAKGKTFDEFKSLMSRYSEKDTATKTDKFNELKNKIVAENDEWTVYKIDTAEEAYLFHGLTKWCIVSGAPSIAKKYFNDYSKDNQKCNFYFIVRKKPIGDEWDYIALQLKENSKKTYWDKNDKSHKTLPTGLNIPELKIKFSNPLPSTWILNDDGSYDVNDKVDLSIFKNNKLVIKDGKLLIKFNKVTGDFDCGSLQLTSLEGCPKEVEGSFSCFDNELTSLKGSPEKVGKNFDCSYNSLTSLKGCPKEVGEDFNCLENDLKSIKGTPEKIRGSFNCSYNNLSSIKCDIIEVGGYFNCVGNKLTSLEGGPEKVGEDFRCDDNKLTSLKGAPEKVGGSFSCMDNRLTSLAGAPKKVGEVFDCSGNTKKFTKTNVKEVSKVSGSIYV